MKSTLNLPLKADAGTIGRGENLTWDQSPGTTGGWSSRLGYEPYFLDSYEPFGAIGRVDSLYVWEMAPALHFIFFEAGGTLYLVHEFGGGTPTLISLATKRHIPTLLDSVSQYTPIPGGLLVTNGQDQPLLIQPWPLGNITQAQAAAVQIVRPFGMNTPPSPEPWGVAPIASSDSARHSTVATKSGGDVAIWWSSTPTAPGYPNLAGVGWTRTTAVEQSSYNYKVSYVSNLGAESPLSEAAVLSWQTNADVIGTRYVPAVRIPVGPPGTVARKLWRSYNWANGSPTEGEDALYLSLIVPNNVEEVVFDYTRQTSLGALEPQPGARVNLPVIRPRYADTYIGRLFFAGDPNDPYTVHYSTQRSPEWFAAGDFIALPQQGGKVTGLKAHYSVLLVFREHSLDVIDENLRATTLLPNVECLAPNSVVGTPLGVVFAARDGLYLVGGGLKGGATVQVKKLSDNQSIREVWQRSISPSGPLLARAVAAWDPIRGEYWCQLPPNGADRTTLGVVWHPYIPSTDGLGSLTLRSGWPVGAFSTMPNGELIFGHYEGNAGQQSGVPSGLFIVSNNRALGLVQQGDVLKPADPPKMLFRTPWIDFGDVGVLKQISYITVYVIATGNIDVAVQTAINGAAPWVKQTPVLAQAPSDALAPVWAASATDAKGVSLPYTATLLDDYSTAMGRAIPLRFSSGHGRCSTFAFQIETTDDVVILGYTLEGTVVDMRTVAGHRS
jgi:hypothetical protein